MNAEELIKLAQENLGGDMHGSALHTLHDANDLLIEGREDDAKRQALRSLRYSLGEFHPTYITAKESS